MIVAEKTARSLNLDPNLLSSMSISYADVMSTLLVSCSLAFMSISAYASFRLVVVGSIWKGGCEPHWGIFLVDWFHSGRKDCKELEP